MNTGLIFDIKKYAINDGPGIRLTVFFKGCNLQCKWCHNPESMSPKVQKMYNAKKCIGALSCIKNCPNNALKMTSEGIVKGIKWIVQIGKHLKTLKKRKFDKVEFKETKGVQFIGIYNDAGEILYVPKVYLELFTEIPETIFNRLTQLIEDERKLKIGFSPNENVDVDDTKKEVSISINDKGIFYKGKEEEDVLFPELTHNQYVELEGHITRGNENSNTIGFAYKNHILTCYPISGKIVEDRTYFFGDCTIRGYVNRMDKNGVFIEKRPRIAYMDILPFDKKTDEDMFSK